MKFLIVHAHPESQSLNAALTTRAVATLTEAGHHTQISDLYAMGFDPTSDRRNFTSIADPDFYRQQREETYAIEHDGFSADIRAEMEKLTWCDGLIFQFPLWWFSVPAILKGWVDRVFAMGFAYGGGRWCDNGPFVGKRAMLSLTTGGLDTAYGTDGLNGPIETVLYPINHGMFHFTGFDVLPPYVAYSINHIGEEGRLAALDAYAERLRTFWTDEPIHYPLLNQFDSKTLRLKASSTMANSLSSV